MSNALDIVTREWNTAHAEWVAVCAKCQTAKDELIGVGGTKEKADDMASTLFDDKIATALAVVVRLGDVRREIETDERLYVDN